MKKQLLALSLVLSTSTFAASTFNCQWIETQEHSENFYQEAQFNFSFSIEDEKVLVTEDTFLERRYSPCWSGNFSSCSFSFSHNSDTWDILDLTGNTLVMSTDAAYWDAELKMTFNDDLTQLNSGDQTVMILSGDDGDGTWISAEFFNCEAK